MAKKGKNQKNITLTSIFTLAESFAGSRGLPDDPKTVWFDGSDAPNGLNLSFSSSIMADLKKFLRFEKRRQNKDMKNI